MKDNFETHFDSEEEKQALVWIFFAALAMLDNGLENWQCRNLELQTWEMIVAWADTVHFGSSYPTEAICSKPRIFSPERSHYRLHHYLLSHVAKELEQARSHNRDRAYSTYHPDNSEMIKGSDSGSVISIALHFYTIDLRKHPDMSLVLRMMGGIPPSIKKY